MAGLATGAQAIGFQAGAASATLGQVLDHVIGLRLEAGETVAPECVSAEVTVGDQRLAGSAVSTQLEGAGGNWSVRVSTSTAIDEPVVSVLVAVGCPARVTRRFVLFADPPAALAPSAPITSPVDALPPAPDRKAPPSMSMSTAAPPAESKTPAVTPDARRVATASSPKPQGPSPAPRRVARVADRAAPAAAVRPRLKLDAAEPAPSTASITAELIEAAASAAAAQAASQAQAQAAQAASAAAARITALEQSIERLRTDSAADREALQVLRQRAVDGDRVGTWLPVLGALTAALAVLALWLGLKLRRLQAERQQTWWTAPGTVAPGAVGADPVPTDVRTESASVPVSTVGPSTAGYSSTRPGTLGPVFTPDPAPEPMAEPPIAALERTQALPVGWREESEASRDVSIEELIDLEQQAEFFIVLGQEEAAIDLLVDHLRNTGGGSPMPYLKLLEIYRRRGDREAYDRTRARFNHRFNAYAPDWESNDLDGRSLEDYPAIVARLQMAWPLPIDAMAELESLLFRKARGELFDMPAYRDVLFLYSLARDLLGREPLGNGNVDVLLPINEGSEFTQPMSLDDLQPGLDSGMVPLDNPPTVPIDLDVTQPGMPDSLFSEPTEPGIGRGRRRTSP